MGRLAAVQRTASGGSRSGCQLVMVAQARLRFLAAELVTAIFMCRKMW